MADPSTNTCTNEEDTFSSSSTLVTTTTTNPFDKKCKIYISRIPAAFDEVIVERLLKEKLGSEDTATAAAVVVNVSLIYPQTKQKDGKANDDGAKESNTNNKANEKKKKQDKDTPHRGFGFATLDSEQRAQQALELGTIRGGVKPTSTKKYTMYLCPIVRNDDNDDEQDQAQQQQPGACFLWNKYRCPYGKDCKFSHEGEGGCLPHKEDNTNTDPSSKKKKCFNYKKGKCRLGDDCPYSHDFEPSTKKQHAPRDDSEKDCLSWKQKGKCNKGDSCPYRHDVQVKNKALEKKHGKKEKQRQPLSVRVFGLNYDTKESHVRAFFQKCGPIMELTFPTFEDSGRSKGYCGILFQSPKAVAEAVKLDGKELHGRWLRVQPGKMYLRQWEEQHEARKREMKDDSTQQQVGEFGQKVKKRKQHGFKDD